METVQTSDFVVGDLLVSPLTGEIQGPTRVVHLQPKVMDVLTCLAESAGELVTRQALLDRVWGASHGADESLTRCVSELRHALDTVEFDKTRLQTVPKRGYRLVEEVAFRQTGSGKNRRDRRIGDRRKQRSAEAAMPGPCQLALIYSTHDAAAALPLAAALEAKGWRVWKSPIETAAAEIPAGCDCFVLCWSANAVNLASMQSAAQLRRDDHALVQVKLDEVPPPEPFDRNPCIDLSGWPASVAGQNAFTRLSNEIQGRLALAASIPVDTTSFVPGFSGGPAIAVLPLENRTGDENLDYAGEGFADEIVDRLQRFRSFPVISRHTSFHIDRGKGLADTCAELGIQYLVTGVLRRHGESFRLRMELIKHPLMETIWSTSELVDSLEDPELQDELSLSLAAQLGPEVERAERRAALPMKSDRATSWHLVRQGVWHQYKLTQAGAARARELFEQALDRDPDSVEGLIHYAWWHFWDISFRRGEPREWTIPEQLARRASAIDPQDCRPVTLMGIARMMRCDHQAAQQHFRHAIDLNPSYGWAYAHMGSSLYLDGQPEKCLTYSTMAIRLSPLDFFLFHAYCDIATANYMQASYQDALKAADLSLSLRAGYWLAHVIKICALVSLDQPEAAAQAVESFVASKPRISDRDIEWIMFSDPQWNRDLLGGLHAAGWKGGGT